MVDWKDLGVILHCSLYLYTGGRHTHAVLWLQHVYGAYREAGWVYSVFLIQSLLSLDITAKMEFLSWSHVGNFQNLC